MRQAFSSDKLLATKIAYFVDLGMKSLGETLPSEPVEDVREELPFEQAAAMAQACGSARRLTETCQEFEIAGVQVKIENLVDRPCGNRRLELLAVFSAPDCVVHR